MNKDRIAGRYSECEPKFEVDAIFDRMNASTRSAVIVQWTARISGTLLLAFLLFMLIGHLLGDANGPNGMSFSSTADALAFVLFPIGPIIGLMLAYKWEFPGGLVSVLSIVALLILRPDLLPGPFIALTVPGILYIIHARVTSPTAGT